MCGHVGAAGTITAEHEKVVRSLLILDSMRGEDSTGLACIGTGVNNNIIARSVGDPFELFRTQKYEKGMRQNNRALIGHNRYATQGKVNVRNAHPFLIEDELIGAHNGTLRNKWSLLNGNRFDVDSEALYDHLYHKGLHDLLGVMNGAWALVWWDVRDGTLNFLRNEERPLYIATLKKEDVIFWASEKWMLDVSLSRSKLECEVTELAVNRHVSVIIGNDRKLGKPVVTPAAGRFVSSVQVGKFQGSIHGGSNKGRYQTNRQQQLINNIAQTNTSGSSAGAKEIGYQSHLGKRAVQFFGMVLESNDNGAKYLDCFLEDDPSESFHLFENSMHNIESLVGEYFTGDVHTVHYGSKGKSYKISASSVVLMAPPKEDVPPKTYPDASGRHVSAEVWNAKHKNCDCCGADVTAGDSVKFTRSGGVLCKDCALDDALCASLGTH